MAHIKRLSAPSTWKILRKSYTWVSKPNPGKRLLFSMALDTFLKEVLNLATTRKEVKYLINDVGVYVNGRQIKDVKSGVGLFDVVSFPEIKKYYRMVLAKNGYLSYVEINEKESNLIPLKIVNKQLVSQQTKDKTWKAGYQYTFFDSTTYFDTKNLGYNVNDSVLYDFSSKQIVEHYPVEKGMTVVLLSKKHLGKVGVIDNISDKELLIKSETGYLKATKDKIYIVGKSKPKITYTKV